MPYAFAGFRLHLYALPALGVVMSRVMRAKPIAGNKAGMLATLRANENGVSRRLGARDYVFGAAMLALWHAKPDNFGLIALWVYC